MPVIDVIDSTWLGVRPAAVAPHIADRENWRRWWPGLDLAVDELRGPKGVRWFVRSVAGERDAGLSGTAELWLQPAFDGAVAHFFLRLDTAAGKRLSRRRRTHVVDEYRRRTKSALWELGDRLDRGRVSRIVR